MNPAGLECLLTRYSLGVKHLDEPGPDPAQLMLLVQAALRAPDHGSLVPFRFVAIQGEARHGFAALFQRAAQDAGKTEAAAALDHERALRAPVTLAVVARIDQGHPLAPAHEQWMAVGGAVANLLMAAHAMGFGGKMLSGAKVRSPRLAEAFCQAGETLVGWIGLGTPARVPAPKHLKSDAASILQTWPS